MSSAHTISIPAGTDKLTLTPSCAFKTVGDPNLSTLNTVSLCIRGQVTLAGAGAPTTVVDGGGLGRVIYVSADGIANISGITVQHGSLSGGTFDGGGGGINNQGTLAISDSTLTSNIVSNGGGGPAIWSGGPLTVNHCLVTANSSAGDGGGIRVQGTPQGVLTPVTINDSTITHNTAGGDGGGGIFFFGADATISNSTIAYNSADPGSGGGLLLDAPEQLRSGSAQNQ